VDKRFVPRDILPADCARLPKLFEKVWKTRTEEEYWKWKYFKPPFDTKGWVIEDENHELAAFTGYWMRPTKIGCREITPAMLVDVMASPEYRGGKHYGSISKQISELLKRRITFGFTNPVSHKLFKTYFKTDVRVDVNIPIYTSIMDIGYNIRSHKPVRSITGPITRWIHNIRLRTTGHRSIIVQQTESIRDEFDQLWEDVKGDYFWIQNRGKEYLQWRYKPLGALKYHIWKAMEGERLVGYLVSTIKHETNRSKGFLIDWLVSSKREDVFRELVKTAICWLMSQKVDLVETWLLDHEKNWAKVLRSYFFIKNKRTRPFLLCAGETVIDPSLLRIEDFFLTIGDSDYLGTARSPD